MEARLPGQAKPPALEYQRAGAERATRTRVRVAPLADGIQYTDPAATWHDLRPTLLHAAFSVPFVIFVLGTFVQGLQLHGGARTMAIGAIGVLVMSIFYDTWREVRRRRSAATIIEVAGGRLKLWHPVHGNFDWAASEISALQAIRAGKYIPMFDSHRGHVRISAWGRDYALLKGRPYAEARWFAGELRRGLGIVPFSSTDFSAIASFFEPPARPEDILDEPEPIQASDAAVQIAVLPDEARRISIRGGEVLRRRLYAIRCRYRDAYNRIGCFGAVVLIGCGIAGIPLVVLPTARVIVISLQCGPHAYLRDNVRFVARGMQFQLTNGQMLNDYLKMLLMALVLIMVPLWGFTCATVVLGTKVLAERFRGGR